jgi:hypothetical protein
MSKIILSRYSANELFVLSDSVIRASESIEDNTVSSSTTIQFIETSNPLSDFSYSNPVNSTFESEAVLGVPESPSSGEYSKENFIYDSFGFTNAGSGSEYWDANDFNYGIGGELRTGIGAFYFYNYAIVEPDPVLPVIVTEDKRPEVESVEFWDYLSTFWNYLNTSSRLLFENFWTGLWNAGQSLIKQAQRFRDATNPQTAQSAIYDDYYQLKLGPLYSKPLSIDPTQPTPVVNINPIRCVQIEPSYDSDNNAIYSDMIEITKNDYDAIRNIAIGTYAVIQIQSGETKNRFFKVKAMFASVETGDRHYPPSSMANIAASDVDAASHDYYMIQLDDADLSYIGIRKFNFYLTTGMAYEIDSWVLDVPELRSNITPNTGVKYYPLSDYSFYNGIIEFNEDLFASNKAQPEDILYCRFTPSIENFLFEMYGSLVGIPDWTKFNFDTMTGNAAINSVMIGLQNPSNRIDYERAMHSYYGLPIAPDNCKVIGLYETYGYEIINISGDIVTFNIPPGSSLHPFVFSGCRMRCDGKSDLTVMSVASDRTSGTVTMVDASSLSFGDRLSTRLYNRFPIKSFTQSPYEEGYEEESENLITVYSNGGAVAINHIIDIMQYVYNEYPELIVYNGGSHDGIYHIINARDVGSTVILSMYKKPANDEPKYNDFFNTSPDDYNKGFAHIAWPTHKYLLLQLKEEYYKAYLDSPIDTIYDSGDMLQKNSPIARNVSIINASMLPGWNELSSFKTKPAINLQSDILEMTSSVYGAKFGEFFPSGFISR